MNRDLHRCLRLGLLLILLVGLAACLPSEAEVGPTAVAQQPPTETRSPTMTATSEPTPSETAVPPTLEPSHTPQPTATLEPTATRPETNALIPQTHDLFNRIAILPDTPLGQVIDFRPTANDANLLELITTESYLRINVASGEVTPTLIPEDSRIIGVDDSGAIWLLLEDDSSTIFALDNAGNQHAYGQESGWLPLVGTAKDLLQDANGDVWLATNEDVRRFDGTQWTIYSREALGMAPPLMEDVGVLFRLAYAAQTQTVWVGECDWVGPGPSGGGGVRWFDGSVWQGSEAPVAEGCAGDIVEGDNGRIWIALNAQLWQFTPADGSWEQFNPPKPNDELRIGYTEELVLDSQDNPWPLFSLCGGASCQVAYLQFRLRNGEWTQFGEPIFAAPLLVFTSDKLPIFFSERRMTFYTLNDEASAFPNVDLAVSAAFLDDADNLWIVGRPSPDLPLIIWQANMRG